MNQYNLQIIEDECRRLYEIDKFPELKDQTILVVGANGLIGSFLSDFFFFLNSKGYNIKLILSSYSEKHKALRIRHLTDNREVKYFSWDCSKPLGEWDLDCEVDLIFFAAGYGQPAKFTKDNIKTTMINIVGVSSLLDKVIKQQKSKSKFLFLSTSEVYGNPKEYPTREDYKGLIDLESSRASYILSKATAENLCLQYNEFKQIETKIARVALTYGPGTTLSDTRVLQDFIFKAHFEKEINMLSRGDSIRNYLYLTNCAEILLNIILRGKETTYNVGGDSEEVSIYTLARKVGSLFNCEVKRGPEEKRHMKSAPSRVGVSMNKYRQEFKKYGNNIVELNEGIRQTIRWYKFMTKPKKITNKEIGTALQEPVSEFLKNKISEFDLQYEEIETAERERIFLETLRHIDSGLRKAGRHRSQEWVDGWAENRDEILSNFIVPKYFGKYPYVRWMGRHIKPIAEGFEYNCAQILQYCLFENYLKETDYIYEFGCGTGHNLLRASEINPNAEIWGLDWAESSQQTIDRINKEFGKSFKCKKFDFFNIDDSFELGPNSGVYTFAALEQVGPDHVDFIDYLISQNPSICLHVEPIAELLQPKDSLEDFLSVKYFEERNYLNNFYNNLKNLEERGKIEILSAKRSNIGSFYIDGYSVVVWRPKCQN